MKLILLSAMSAFCAISSFAQEPAASTDADTIYALPEIQVKGDRVESGYLNSLPSVSKLSGNSLERRKQATVGETLSREPGVSSTFFGPNASRPVIRGLDGDRVRVLENGTGTLDASSASPDHAVSVDPLVLDSIEIVRGPSALLYGSTAIGGVVNLRTARIADKLLDSSEFKLSGALSSVDSGRNLGLLYRTRAGDHWVLEWDGSGRGTEDYKIPGFARSSEKRNEKPLAPGEEEESGKVINSSSRTYQTGLGATYVRENGHTGFALSGVKSYYGTVAKKGVMIDLERFRLDFESEHRFQSFIETARVKGAGTVYRHGEIDEGAVGTTFRNKGFELRADFKHRKLGAMEGVFGTQFQMFELSALGDEAFIPTTLNHSIAIFGFEEWKVGSVRPSLGLRLDQSGVKAKDHPTFGPEASRTFFAPSLSAGLAYDFTEATSVGLQTTYTERAPNYQELFANGPHVATNAYEIGNTNFKQERSVGAELFVKHKSEDHGIRGAIFVQNFSSFLALEPTDEPDPTGEGLTVYRFEAVSALLAGAEFEWTYLLPVRVWDGRLETELQADFVRGVDRTDDGNLPRMPPVRESLALHYKKKGWDGFVQYQRSEKQGLTAENELPTDAYHLVHVGVEAPVSTSYGSYRLSFRVNNIFNEEARVHSSFIKDIAPLPGRNFVFGLQAAL